MSSDVQAWAQSPEKPKPSPSPQSRVQSFKGPRAWASGLSSPKPGLQALPSIHLFFCNFLTIFDYFWGKKINESLIYCFKVLVPLEFYVNIDE